MNAIFTILSLLASQAADCPQGGVYVGTVEGLRGACAVAAMPVAADEARSTTSSSSAATGHSDRDGSAGATADSPNGSPHGASAGFLVCVPEELPSGDASAPSQLARIDLAGDGFRRSDGLAGSLDCAADVAVSADGVVAVADASGVVRLLRNGVWTVVGEGTLAEPSGIAFHPRGIAVSDRRLRAVLLLDDAGREIARCGVGQVADPRGLATTGDGSIVVADRLKDCLWRFAADGEGLPARMGRSIGEFGSNPGQFSAPGDVAILERNGVECLVVADELNHRVQVLGGDGRFVGFFGMHALIPRMGGGRIHYPRSVAIGRDGRTLAVAEAFEDRVQLFELSAEPTPPDGSRSVEWISSHFGPDASCAADLLAVVDVEAQAVAILDARTTPPIHMAVFGGGGATPFRFSEISAMGVEPQSARVWVADRGRARVDVYAIDWDRSREPIVDQFIPRLARSLDLAAFAGRISAKAGGALRTPDVVDIEFDPQDPARVLLLDWENRAVLATDPRLSDAVIERLPEEARSPEELAISADGSMAVVDPVARRLFLRSPGGEWTSLSALGAHALVRPSGVGFTPSGSLVVSDAARDAVLVGTADRARVVGERGVLDEQFWDPQSVLGSPKGVIVIDRGNHRFQRFGPSTEGAAGDSENEFAWNLTGSLGRYYDRKRRGSPGGPPAAPALVPPPVPARSGGEGGGA